MGFRLYVLKGLTGLHRLHWRHSLRRFPLTHVWCACCSCPALQAPNPQGASGREWCYIEPQAGLCCLAHALLPCWCMWQLASGLSEAAWGFCGACCLSFPIPARVNVGIWFCCVSARMAVVVHAHQEQAGLRWLCACWQ